MARAALRSSGAKQERQGHAYQHPDGIRRLRRGHGFGVYFGRWTDALGLANKLAIQAVADQVSGSGTITLSVAIEHSCDQRNWAAKSGTPEINAQTITAATRTTWFGSDSGSTPTLGYVPLEVTLGGTTPAAHIKIHVSGRDDA